MSADSVPSSKTNMFQSNSIHSSIVAILELIRGAQCLIEVIWSSGEEMWRVDAYQIRYYSRGIEGEKRTHPRFVDWLLRVLHTSGDFEVFLSRVTFMLVISPINVILQDILHDLQMNKDFEDDKCT